MKSENYWIFVLCVSCCFLFLVSSISGISSGEKKQLETFCISTLSGLRGVNPIVIFEDEENLGLSKEAFQAQVELELRKVAVKIISDTDPNLSSDDVGTLMVMLGVDKTVEINGTPIYSFSFSVCLYQFVELIRNPKIRTRAATWPLVHISEYLVVREKDVEQTIQNTLTKKMNIFINDYLAANPKEPEKKQSRNSIYDAIRKD